MPRAYRRTRLEGGYNGKSITTGAHQLPSSSEDIEIYCVKCRGKARFGGSVYPCEGWLRRSPSIYVDCKAKKLRMGFVG